MATNLDPFSLALQLNGQAINGIRSASTYFTVDGGENLDTGASTSTNSNSRGLVAGRLQLLEFGMKLIF